MSAACSQQFDHLGKSPSLAHAERSTVPANIFHNLWPWVKMYQKTKTPGPTKVYWSLFFTFTKLGCQRNARFWPKWHIGTELPLTWSTSTVDQSMTKAANTHVFRDGPLAQKHRTKSTFLVPLAWGRALGSTVILSWKLQTGEQFPNSACRCWGVALSHRADITAYTSSSQLATLWIGGILRSAAGGKQFGGLICSENAKTTCPNWSHIASTWLQTSRSWPQNGANLALRYPNMAISKNLEHLGMQKHQHGLTWANATQHSFNMT